MQKSCHKILVMSGTGFVARLVKAAQALQICLDVCGKLYLLSAPQALKLNIAGKRKTTSKQRGERDGEVLPIDRNCKDSQSVSTDSEAVD